MPIMKRCTPHSDEHKRSNEVHYNFDKCLLVIHAPEAVRDQNDAGVYEKSDQNSGRNHLSVWIFIFV